MLRVGGVGVIKDEPSRHWIALSDLVAAYQIACGVLNRLLPPVEDLTLLIQKIPTIIMPYVHAALSMVLQTVPLFVVVAKLT